LSITTSASEVIGTFDVGAVLYGQHILAGGLESGPNRVRRLKHIPDALSDHHLVFRSQVLLLEGLSKDFGDLLCRSCRVASKNELWILQKEFSQVLVLKLRFFNVVSDWQSINPE